ncbi:tRNA 2-thiouridine synthesizing protein C [Halopseudomonas xinjiangensis]|uniref:tRNA 2-thiouridine synthesizing protein C n=1 Tax=Halopseudomonas xinjiangensis TaxID=487184 RepID=A0A1H1R683_9GAMM|nr:sulfurtransferase complex subunit TusC [Halopseudomonas xinjiangensis]SDS31251.1 tRNA 2-thiouridine synthesizing protein C [Halopseudomonas xinjiangensis]
MRSLLIITRQPPARPAAREALDVALAAAAFGVPTGILFMDDGVLQLLKGQDAEQLQLKALSANLQALPIFDVEDVMVCHHSMTERGILANQCMLDARPVSGSDIPLLLDSYDQVVSL